MKEKKDHIIGNQYLAETFTAVADKYNSLEQRTNRFLGRVYIEIKSAASTGHYAVSINISDEYFSQEFLDHCKEILRSRGFSVEIDSSNYYSLYNSPGIGGYHGNDAVVFKIGWKNKKEAE